MSKLMEQRKAAKTKKSTIILSLETVRDAITIGKSLLQKYEAEGTNDPQVEQAVQHLEGLLTSQPDQMQSEGAVNVEDYFDDAILPEVARQAKNEVDMIAQKRREARPVQAATQSTQPVAQPQKTSAVGNDQFVSDRDEKGNPKAPEKAEVPRLAAKKKEAVPVPVPAAPPAAAPKPAVGGGAFDSLLDKLPSDVLAKWVKDLTGNEAFEQDKDVQAAVESLAGKLQARPVEAAPAAPGAAPMAQAASAKKAEAFGGKQAPPFGKKDEKKDEKKDDKKASISGLNFVAAEQEKVAVAPPGSENVVHALKKEDVDNPFAVAWSMYNKGDKMSAVKAAAEVLSKMASGAAGGAWSTDQDKGNITEDGGRTPEVGEAHSKIDEAPARLDRPATTLPIKLAGEMTAQKAVKEAERLGKELKQTYLDAKAICTVNDSRPVREFVESIFRAGSMADEAVKTLNKLVMQEESEEAAAKIREKSNKKSSFKGLALVTSAE